MHDAPVLSTTTRQRRWRRPALVLLAVSSLFILFMPTQLSPVYFAPVTILAIYSLFLLIPLLGLVGAIILLVPAYPRLFRHAWGIVICIGLIQILALIMNRGLLDSDPGWLAERLVLLATMWGIAAMLGLGIVLLYYLAINDHGVNVFLLTGLLAVWVLVLYMQQLGPQQMLSASVTNQAGLVLLPPVVCLSFWVLLLAPLSFLGHTVHLINRELQGERTQMEAENELPVAGESG